MATKASAAPAAPWAAAPIAEPAADAPAANAGTAPETPAAAPVVAADPVAPAVPPVTDPVPETLLQEADAVVKDAEETVIVTAPKAFMLRIDNDLLVPVKAGVQRMRKSWAEHWYSIANGLKKFEEKL